MNLLEQSTPSLSLTNSEIESQIWIWTLFIKTILYKRFLNWNKIFKKIKKLLEKRRSLWLVHFVLTIIFVLTLASDITLASDMANLYENDAFSILVLLTKKQYSRFLKKNFVFQKICFRVLVSKTFKISTACLMKTCSSLNGGLFWKSLVSFLRRTFALSVGFKIKPLRKRIFPVLRQKHTQIFT